MYNKEFETCGWYACFLYFVKLWRLTNFLTLTRFPGLDVSPQSVGFEAPGSSEKARLFVSVHHRNDYSLA